MNCVTLLQIMLFYDLLHMKKEQKKGLSLLEIMSECLPLVERVESEMVDF